MKIIKYLFFLLLIAIIAGAIYIATKDGDYHVEETAIINAPLPVVFNEVNNYNNWEAWGPWRNETEDFIVKNKPETRGEGGGYNWDSDDICEGEIITTKVMIDDSIEREIVYNTAYAEYRRNMQ